MDTSNTRPRGAVNGEETDAFGECRRLYRWRPGERKQVKRRANKRERRQGQEEGVEQVQLFHLLGPSEAAQEEWERIMQAVGD